MVWAGIPNREDWIGESVSTKMKRDNITEPCIVCRKERATVADGKYCIECYKEKITQAIMGKSEDDYCVDCGHYTSPNWEKRVECECSCHKE